MAIEHDATSSATSNTGNATLSWSHTLGNVGSTGLIIVAAGGEEISGGSSNQNITGVTFDGVSMTAVGSASRTDSHSVTGALYELRGANVPSAGTYTVVVSYSSANHDASAAGCMSFKGVKDQAREAVQTTTAQGGSSLSRSITTLTDNALIVAAYSSQNTPNATSTTSDTRAFRAVPGSIEQMETCGFYRTQASAGATSVAVSVSNPESQTLVVACYEAEKAVGSSPMFFSGGATIG